MMSAPPAAASVVIAAHNEENTIGRCLAALAKAAPTVSLDIVVAANGCRDATVEVARRTPGVKVLDLARASKVGALNAADEVATSFPRLYLDADVVLDVPAMLDLVRRLSVDEALLAAPAVDYDTSDSDVWVRAFYDALRQVRARSVLLVGRGVFGLSRAGRARFDHFPPLQGDDYFVARLFTPSETILTAGTVTVTAPRSWRDLLAIRTRIASGNAELSRSSAAVLPASSIDLSRTTAGTARTLASLVRTEPRRIPSVALFVLLTLAARLRAQWSDTSNWARDSSTR